MGKLRDQGDLYKLPGVGETIVWAQALLALGDEADLDDTLGAALKVHEDVRPGSRAQGARGCLSRSPLSADAARGRLGELAAAMRDQGTRVGRAASC